MITERPRHAWQLEHFMRNSAFSLDVLALEVRAHGASAAADRMTAIARQMRERAPHAKEIDNKRFLND